jgi:hypothetical protein
VLKGSFLAILNVRQKRMVSGPSRRQLVVSIANIFDGETTARKVEALRHRIKKELALFLEGLAIP